MRILLLEPSSASRGISIGIGYLCGSLKRAGHEVIAYSATDRTEYDEGLGERYHVEDFKPDLVGYSIYYTSYYPFIRNLRLIRQWYKGPVVVGGPQVRLERERILRDVPELDFAVVGEGEETLVELLEALKDCRDMSAINGLIYRDGGEVVSNPLRRPARNLDALPFPDYSAFGIKRTNSYYLVTSRGCPFRCTFCNRNSDVWRGRRPESLIEELKHGIEKYGAQDFSIIDDSFNIRPERIIEFCDLLDKEGIRMPWRCTGARADRLPDEMVRRMKEAGCLAVNIGVETLQPEVFATLNKGESISQILEGIGTLQKHGIEVAGYFMIGIPGDTPDGTLDTFYKSRKLKLAYSAFGVLLPFPGTSVCEQLENDSDVKWLHDYRTISDGWSLHRVHSVIRSSFETPGYPENEKVRLYNKIRTMQGDPRPPYKGSMLLFALHAVWFVFRYDFFRAPITLYRLARNFLKRIIKSRGRGVSVVIYDYDENHLPPPQELRRRYDA